ncbi:hypothetical protein [Streptomyces antimycoticus]|uniref:hypothetical protein n=1 Tax=Streptomyces antimycoticus TaxID=68175 RepID=UPI0031E7378C
MAASPLPVLPDDRLAAGIARLALRYRGHFSPETIQRVVSDSYERLVEHARSALIWWCWPSIWPPSASTRSPGVEAHPAAASRACCSSAATTPADPRCRRPPRPPRRRPHGGLLGRHAPGCRVEPVVAQVLTEAGVDVTDAFPKLPDRRGRPGR